MKRSLEIIIIILLLLLPISIIIAIPNIIIDKNVVLEYNQEFIDKYEAHSILKDYSKEVVRIDNIDTSKVGKYEVNYNLEFGLFNIRNKKYVTVIDKIKPTINLEGPNEVIVCPNHKYIEQGFKAVDEYDGDITNKVEIETKDNTIYYKVKDNSSNYYETTRNIIYEDKEKPVITLKGNSNIYLYLKDTYKEQGAVATDNCDKDLSNKIEITGKVNTNQVGTYTLTYKVVDSSNNTSEVTRNIYIKKKEVYNNGSSNGSNNGYIYLTFDDGPSYLTPTILDILDEQQVKVTFFVTSSVYNNPNILKRAYNSNHTIALHTYSHNYKQVYSSVSNYFSDLNNIDNAVNSIIGLRSKIIRFPGGSSNLVSKNYSVGIMSTLANEVVSRGYNYFDWNIDSNDAGSSVNNSNSIYNNVVNNLSKDQTNIVLMHDSAGHEATVQALRNIITYGKINGYTFKAITSQMKAVRHRINN